MKSFKKYFLFNTNKQTKSRFLFDFVMKSTYLCMNERMSRILYQGIWFNFNSNILHSALPKLPETEFGLTFKYSTQATSFESQT